MSCASLVDAPPRRALWSFSAGRLSSPLRVCLLRSFVYTTGVLAPDKPALCVCALFRSLSHAHALGTTARKRAKTEERTRAARRKTERKREKDDVCLRTPLFLRGEEIGPPRSNRGRRFGTGQKHRSTETEFRKAGTRPSRGKRTALKSREVNANFHRAFSST